METIIPIKGKVNYSITLDASVWIFDDRKIELEEFLKFDDSLEKNENDYIKAQAERWERERTGIKPPVNKSIKRFEKERVLNGSFVIPLAPFLSNADPIETGLNVKLVSENGDEYILTMEEAMNGFLGFSKDGKPLREDGPVHFYYGDGSNAQDPYKHISSITII
ncbi:peptidyl-prolyl cis-trans isomerase [Pseudalkalibacillus hwajinpoensis]|uniref:Peptidyl-prolyl cis-trans isomerase n=1 Tax=Guptibacillus hwajinpoensis TaxID=208199 RepID=A0A4U1MMA0_9BACL|nr:peptidyl-prolyl cis-trans isomerase [Pseudalkalibacillus hwajinpoensis]TKD71796.1 peptidyl-prolyl cis-trans isomerase [Pseudalkalibacillus hwajinpoensis]